MWIISYLSQAHANIIHLVCALAQPMFLQLQQGWGGWGQGWWLYGCDITIPVTVTVLTARLKAPLLSTGCEYSAVNCVLILSLSNIHIAANDAASMKINISLTFYNKWPKRAVVTMQWCCTHRSSEDRFSVFEQTAETCEANQTTTLRVRTNLKLILICVQHSWIKPWPPPSSSSSLIYGDALKITEFLAFKLTTTRVHHLHRGKASKARSMRARAFEGKCLFCLYCRCHLSRGSEGTEWIPYFREEVKWGLCDALTGRRFFFFFGQEFDNNKTT